MGSSSAYAISSSSAVDTNPFATPTPHSVAAAAATTGAVATGTFATLPDRPREAPKALKERFWNLWGLVPALFVLVMSVISLAIVLIYHNPLLAIPFGLSTLAACYLIYLSYQYRLLKGMEEQLRLYQEQNDTFKASNDTYKASNKDLRVEITRLEATIRCIEEQYRELLAQFRKLLGNSTAFNQQFETNVKTQKEQNSAQSDVLNEMRAFAACLKEMVSGEAFQKATAQLCSVSAETGRQQELQKLLVQQLDALQVAYQQSQQQWMAAQEQQAKETAEYQRQNETHRDMNRENREVLSQSQELLKDLRALTPKPAGLPVFVFATPTRSASATSAGSGSSSSSRMPSSGGHSLRSPAAPPAAAAASPAPK